MSYAVVPFRDFAGLDLVSAPDQSSCIDALNVDFDRPGSVRSRDGYTSFLSSAAASRVYRLFPAYVSSHRHLLGVIAGNLVHAYTGAGASAANQSVNNPAAVRFAALGTPTAEAVYFTRGTSDTIAKWNGSAFSAPLGMPQAAMIAVQPADNRLVAGNIDSTTQSRVQFSDPGAPETWGATNYVDLAPGDGEAIEGLVTWRDLVFAFKRTKFFVFSGNSTDATGGAVFNQHTVSAGVGVHHSGCVAAGRDGVYFMGLDGIYVTTGGVPVKVSGAIDPFFLNTASSFFQTPAMGTESGIVLGAQMYWDDVGNALYVVVPTGDSPTNNRTLVYRPSTGVWSVWDIAATAMTRWAPSSGYEFGNLYFGYAAGANDIGKFGPAYTTDNGTAITSRYRSGFYDLGTEDEKQVPRTKVWGTGTVGYSMSRDFGDLGTTDTLTLGTSPAIARAESRSATNRSGTVFSHQFASTSPWSVQRLHQEIQGERPVTASTT